jgi:hypothetical protein
VNYFSNVQHHRDCGGGGADGGTHVQTSHDKEKKNATL